MDYSTLTTEQKQDIVDNLFNKIGSLVRKRIAYSLRYNSDEDVEEVLNDVFLNLFKGLNKFNGNCKLETYTYAITTNAIINFIRKKKVITKRKNAIRNEFFSNRKNILYKNFNAPVVDYKIKDVIKSILDKMSFKDRDLILKKHMDGLTFESIASKLNVNRATTHRKLKAAEKKFIEIYYGMGYETKFENGIQFIF